MSATKPILSIGVLADIQYADVDDGFDFSQTKKRCFRKSADCLEEAIKTFDNYSLKVDFENYKKANDLADEEILKRDSLNLIISESPSDKPAIKTLLELGDLTDGRCKKKAKNDNDESIPTKAIDKLLNIIKSSKCTQQNLHCCGNHEFYNFTRPELEKYYYSSDLNNYFTLFADTFAFIQPLLANPRIKIVHLDSYDISQIGRETGSPKQKTANSILAKNNSENYKLNNTNSKEGLTGDQMRFVAYTGGLSPEQLNWLEENLKNLDNDKNTDLIILMSHCNIHPKSLNDSKSRSNTLWNFSKVFKIIEKTNKNSKILAHFAGHHHDGGYFYDTGEAYKFTDGATNVDDDDDSKILADSNRKIHHITMGGIIERTDQNHFAVLEFYERFAVLRGYGDCKSRVLKYADNVLLKC